jgi:serine/threonine-protein kinase SRPK3
MNAMFRRAAAKKQKYFAKKQKYVEEQEDSLSDVDEMEVSENMLGRLFNNRYLTLKYLGSGTFSKVWLVYDIPTNCCYAMKMYYPKYQEDGEYEVRYLKQLRETQNVVKLFNDFTFRDDSDEAYQNGAVSVCLIVELMGRSLMTVFDMYDKGVPFDVFKNLTYNSLVSLNEIHSNGLIHTDIKLENLMLDQLTGDVKGVIEWFQGLKAEQLYEQYLNSFIPPNWGELGKNKQKAYKKKIKVKAAKALTKQLHSVIMNHVNEMSQYKVDLDDNETSGDNSKLNNELDIDEMPSLVNLEEVKKQEIEEGRTIKDDDNNAFLHDDELDMDLIKASVKIADLGNACPQDNIDDDDIQIRSYRAPEVVMGELYNEKADIWSMACLFYELLTHDHVFEVDSEHDDNVEQDRLLLSQMYATLGKMPYDYCIDSERTYQLFDEKGRVKKHKKVDYNLLEDRIKEKRPDLSETERQQACQLIRSMMQYEIKKRFSARDCMKLDIYTNI